MLIVEFEPGVFNGFRRLNEICSYQRRLAKRKFNLIPGIIDINGGTTPVIIWGRHQSSLDQTCGGAYLQILL